MMGKPNAGEFTAPQCPFHTSSIQASEAVCAAAANFDVFDNAFQVDPPEALRWAREQLPVFYSEKMGYWVVARYDDVKAIFRDVQGFSPSNALEKFTPNSAAADAVLRSYDYAMSRTLVNEDEPQHIERRRALLHSFIPEELAHHEPMVRRLTRQYVDRFINRGAVDLVDEMLWEIPLQVALHFLGVPEEDMDTLRQYSIAHTVNTWGRPTEEQQLEVAESVGRFWQYAGKVLAKMRRDPSGHGWMEYAIRRQRELPDVITDSYLHSMMMAGIVAAHETTANATANAMRLLLSDPSVWEELCSNPNLIPNAVEECLRLSGSIVAWRRLALADVTVGGVLIPKGAKLLIVMASANHDRRHFENPDMLDIFRDNTTDHLTFGYGSHQCLGKNLARMEMRIFLEEFTRRIPHMRLVPDQEFKYLPNVSFRGPDHLLVQWDPALNPERGDPSILEPKVTFPIGAPASRSITRMLRVAETKPEADGVMRLVLEDSHGRDLPGWTAGAHLDVLVGGYERKYSLCGASETRQRHEIAVLLDEGGRGGSAYIHKMLRVGDIIEVRGPKNHFRLDEEGGEYLLVAGGIGITPIIAMADRLRDLGKTYHIHYAGRSTESMAFLARLERDHGDRLTLYRKDKGERLDLWELMGELSRDAQVYVCGPTRLIDEAIELAGKHPLQVHVERFSSTGKLLDPSKEHGFDVELRDSGVTIQVRPDETILQALRAKGIDVPSDCEEGLCGSCEVSVVAGAVDHRDAVLSDAERRSDQKIMTCCSRACGDRLTLAI